MEEGKRNEENEKTEGLKKRNEWEERENVGEEQRCESGVCKKGKWCEQLEMRKLKKERRKRKERKAERSNEDW